MKVFLERPEENRENREKFFLRQGIDAGRVVSAEIVHGTKVEIITFQKYTDKRRPSLIGISSFGVVRQVIPGTDALVTKEKNVFLSITVADCLPIFFYDPVARVIGIAHAGWRGLAGGVLENTLAALRVPPEEVLVWLGPAIGPHAFEVGPEVRQAFLEGHAEAAVAFVPSVNAGRFMADLYALARLRLAASGVRSVHGGGFCTYSDPRFYSYRRNARTGRFASLVWLV